MASRLNRADWVRMGIEQLKTAGPAGMTLDALCRAAQRTKGSFYAHFADANAFASAVLEHWRREQTEAVIDALPADAQAAVQRLDDIVQTLDWDFEHHMRLWSHSNPHVLQEVAAVDQRRMAFLSQLHQTLGLPAEQARQKAVLSYACLLGVIAIHASWPAIRSEAQQLSQTLHEALFAAPGGPPPQPGPERPRA